MVASFLFLDVGVVADAVHEFFLVTVVLLPEEVVHDVGSLKEQAEHLELAFAEVVDAGGEGVLGVFVREMCGLLNGLGSRFRFGGVAGGDTDGQGCDNS